MNLCSCGSKLTFKRCCGPFLSYQAIAQTPQQLMRSRYTAYSQANIDYIKKTMLGKPLLNFDEVNVKQWAQTAIWLDLKVINEEQINPELGFVEFIVRFIERNHLKTIHERSEFHKYNEQWFYVDGTTTESIKKSNNRIPRNTACPCGSGKKFKNCHER